MLHKLSILLFSTMVLSLTLYAQTIEDVAKKAHLANINALLIFTSQEGLNSGLYHFTNVGVDMEVYHLPFSFNLESNDSHLEYFIVGNVGYSKVFISKDIEIPPSSRLNYKNHLQTYTAGLGGGARYKMSNSLNFSLGGELIYSRSGASVSQPDDDIGDAISDFFNKEYNDNFSYKFFVASEFKPKVKGFKPYIKASYKLYETKSSFNFDEYTNFTTQSSILSLAFGAETEKIYGYERSYVTLEAYLNGNYLFGEVEDIVKFSSYASLGSVAYWYDDSVSWIQRYFLELNTIRAEGLEGYNIGLGFSINY